MAEIVAVVGTEHPIGAMRSAERLAERSGLAVTADDVAMLVELGLITVAGRFTKRGRSYDLYAPAQLDRLAADPARRLAEVVADREHWLAASMTTEQAAQMLGWRWRELHQVAADNARRPRQRTGQLIVPAKPFTIGPRGETHRLWLAHRWPAPTCSAPRMRTRSRTR